MIELYTLNELKKKWITHTCIPKHAASCCATAVPVDIPVVIGSSNSNVIVVASRRNGLGSRGLGGCNLFCAATASTTAIPGTHSVIVRILLVVVQALGPPCSVCAAVVCFATFVTVVLPTDDILTSGYIYMVATMVATEQGR